MDDDEFEDRGSSTSEGESFDSSSDEDDFEASSGETPAEANDPDSLFYDPSADDRDARYLNSLRAYHRGTRFLPRDDEKIQLMQEGSIEPPPDTDAILSCPYCFSTLCVDCQQHVRYPNQYRAMFVQNCRIDIDGRYAEYPTRTVTQGRGRRDGRIRENIRGNRNRQRRRGRQSQSIRSDIAEDDPSDGMFHHQTRGSNDASGEEFIESRMVSPSSTTHHNRFSQPSKPIGGSIRVSGTMSGSFTLGGVQSEPTRKIVAWNVSVSGNNSPALDTDSIPLPLPHQPWSLASNSTAVVHDTELKFSQFPRDQGSNVSEIPQDQHDLYASQSSGTSSDSEQSDEDDDDDDMYRFRRKKESRKKISEKSSSHRDATESEDTNPTDEILRPVYCIVCNTEVGVYDQQDVYHFYHVLASEP